MAARRAWTAKEDAEIRRVALAAQIAQDEFEIAQSEFRKQVKERKRARSRGERVPFRRPAPPRKTAMETLLTLARRFGRSHASVRMRAKRIGARSRTTPYGQYGDYTWVNAVMTDGERKDKLEELEKNICKRPVNDIIEMRTSFIEAWERQDEAARKRRTS